MDLIPRQTAELHDLLWRLRAGAAAPEQLSRLERMVCEDPRVRAFYVRYMHLCADLHWNAAEDGERAAADTPASKEGSGVGVQDSESLVQPIVIDTSITHYPSSTTYSSLGSWLFSYTVATVFVGLLILGAWAVKITHCHELADNNSRRQTASGLSAKEPEMVFVGRITGMVDVEWSKAPNYLPPAGVHVSLGRRYVLDAGLMEITYDSGARVILEGPCTYTVESSTRGYLALGKLTARVETDREIGRQGDREKKPGDESSLSPSPFLPISPSFVVRTPTAVVTDLGTEFGVEVSEDGNTTSHVFRGSVKVQVAGDAGSASDTRQKEMILRANESARVERAGRVRETPQMPAEEKPHTVRFTHPTPPPVFVRQMPKRAPIELFNTGIGVKEGEPDPHWRIVARSDDPDFKPRPATVKKDVPGNWLTNDPERSQWITLAGDGQKLPDGVVYTFRTTFDLTGLRPGTAAVRGWFIVDNHVRAIRLNSRELSLAEHGTLPPYDLFVGFFAARGFVEEVNALEIEVENDLSAPPHSASPMGLRVKLEGTAIQR